MTDSTGPLDSNAPAVAVVIPVYRPALRFLREAIDSVRQQTIADWQLILVDDAGGDPAVTQLCTAAAFDGGHDLELAEAQVAGLCLTPGCTLGPEDIRNLQRAGHCPVQAGGSRAR